jgi:hypothetical protein
MVHWKMVRHFHEVGHLHELTFSCYRRMPLLTSDSWQETLARRIDAAGTATASQLANDPRFARRRHLLRSSREGTGKASGTLPQCHPPASAQIDSTRGPVSGGDTLAREPSWWNTVAGQSPLSTVTVTAAAASQPGPVSVPPASAPSVSRPRRVRLFDVRLFGQAHVPAAGARLRVLPR